MLAMSLMATSNVEIAKAVQSDRAVTGSVELTWGVDDELS
jgi:hypothetical protein